MTRLASQNQAGAEPFIALVVSDEGEGFGMILGTTRTFFWGFQAMRYFEPVDDAGDLFSWGVERLKFAMDRQTILEINARWLFKTEAEARAEIERRKAEPFRPEELGPPIPFVPRERAEIFRATLPAAKQDLLDAQTKILREQYPDTTKALNSLHDADECSRAQKLEEVFRSFAVDSARLRKGESAHLNYGGAFHQLPFNPALVARMAKALDAQTPYDAVDCELAANWRAEGYSKMKPSDYTAKINAKLGANLSVSATKGRAITKLRLTSERPEGRPANNGELP